MIMSSVTQRIHEIAQPYGGYLKLSDFEKACFDDGVILSDFENVSGSRIGLVVDYLTRFYFSGDNRKAFNICLLGAKVAKRFFGLDKAVDICMEDLAGFKKFDTDAAITRACELAAFDVFYRNPLVVARTLELHGSLSVIFEEPPDNTTIENIRVMLHRSAAFFEKCGSVTVSGFDFAPFGYSEMVLSGDGDFLTADTLWDMKVYKPSTKIDKNDRLQVLMYWIMGQHSKQEIFKGITKLGLYNPRQNVAYTLEVAKIPYEVIREVEEKVICY